MPWLNSGLHGASIRSSRKVLSRVFERLIRPARNIYGSLRLPGDKSISHRYAMLAGLRRRHLALHQLLHRRRLRLLLACMEALGAKSSTQPRRTPSKSPASPAASASPPRPLDCGNSGSTMRMISGLSPPSPTPSPSSATPPSPAAPWSASASPSSRWARKSPSPTATRPSPSTAVRSTPSTTPRPSPAPRSRPHPLRRPANRRRTPRPRIHPHPRPQRAGPARLRRHPHPHLRSTPVSIPGPPALHAIDATVPGDISSAAFFLCAALLFPGSNLVLDSLGLNPTRAALLDVSPPSARTSSPQSRREARRTGRHRQVNARRPRASDRRISGALAAQLIDELPVLAAIAPLHQRRHPHPRRQGTPRQGVRPHRPGREKPARHGRRSHRVRRRPRRPRRPNPPRRHHRLRRRPSHRHGLQRRRSPRRPATRSSRAPNPPPSASRVLRICWTLSRSGKTRHHVPSKKKARHAVFQAGPFHRP
jgi:3-phosphoshikimate 1-carboxyvinyltransferase